MRLKPTRVHSTHLAIVWSMFWADIVVSSLELPSLTGGYPRCQGQSSHGSYPGSENSYAIQCANHIPSVAHRTKRKKKKRRRKKKNLQLGNSSGLQLRTILRTITSEPARPSAGHSVYRAYVEKRMRKGGLNVNNGLPIKKNSTTPPNPIMGEGRYRLVS